VSAEQVLAEMSFEPLIADEIEALETPTEDELALLRTELDQRGQITDVGKWVTRQDDGSFAFVEQEKPKGELPSSW